VSNLTIPWHEGFAFDEEFDVIVAGYGFAGAVSAISASDAGAKVLLVEKMPDPGGISICSHGAVCSTRNPDGAFTYLKATNSGRTPDSVLRAFADGMQELEEYVRGLAEVTGAEFMIRERGGNYPLPGEDSFYYTQITAILTSISRRCAAAPAGRWCSTCCRRTWSSAASRCACPRRCAG
jgi:glycine/D-amino acid oxidase-like deaminating enzyme